jgi:hypothetical protein
MNELGPKVRNIGKKLVKRHGVFWIPKVVAELMLTDNSCSAIQIYTYLAIARHTDETGMFSTLGQTGIAKKLGLNVEQYQRVERSLRDASINGERLLYTAEEWRIHSSKVNANVEYENKANVYNPNYIPEKPLLMPPLNKGNGKKGYSRWALNTFDCSINDRIWFHNDLIEDVGRKEKPLRKLLRYKNKDHLAKVLLLMYSHYDISFGGIYTMIIGYYF